MPAADAAQPCVYPHWVLHLKEITMPNPASRKPLDTDPAVEPDAPEPDYLEADPDEGLVRAAIPQDPEHDRMVDPEE